MASTKIYSADGAEKESIELNASVFDIEPNVGLVHQVAVALMASKRQGNHETKVRHEVQGGGKKPFNQKGTGNARQGSIREPHMRGGGVVFGPHKRSYRKTVPVKMSRKALCCVLTDRVRNDALCVLDELSIDGVKTKSMLNLWEALAPEGRKTLLVTAENNTDVVKSARNLERLTVRTAADVNALDVLDAKRVIVVKDALTNLEARLG